MATVVGSDQVDLVLVLTSMPMHGPITRAALEAGKHVLVEKPMAVTLPEAREILELARHSPGYLLCAPHVILSNTYQAMWRRINAGDIGRPLSARGLYGWAGPDWTKWFYEQGGGSLFDLGVYNVVALTGLLGPAKRVMAMAGVAIPEREIQGERVQVEADDNVHLLMDFGGNTYAVVTTGFTLQRYHCAGIEVYGSEGTIQMVGEDWAPRGYELWQNSVGRVAGVRKHRSRLDLDRWVAPHGRVYSHEHTTPDPARACVPRPGDYAQGAGVRARRAGQANREHIPAARIRPGA